MPINYSGSLCARRDCHRPDWKDGLCNRCWRLARLFGKDPRMFAYEPLNGFRGPRDAAELPWEQWEQRARARGIGIADLLNDAVAADRLRSDPRER